MSENLPGEGPRLHPLQVARTAQEFIRDLYGASVTAVGVREHPDGWVAEVEAISPVAITMPGRGHTVFFRVHLDQASAVLFHYQSPAGRVDRGAEGYWVFDAQVLAAGPPVGAVVSGVAEAGGDLPSQAGEPDLKAVEVSGGGGTGESLPPAGSSHMENPDLSDMPVAKLSTVIQPVIPEPVVAPGPVAPESMVVAQARVLSPREEAVLAALGEAGELDLLGLASACGMRLRDLRDILGSLMDAGLVWKERQQYRLRPPAARVLP